MQEEDDEEGDYDLHGYDQSGKLTKTSNGRNLHHGNNGRDHLVTIPICRPDHLSEDAEVDAAEEVKIKYKSDQD